jgi:hypothetical protein
LLLRKWKVLIWEYTLLSISLVNPGAEWAGRRVFLGFLDSSVPISACMT